jgi:hypothetical protein
VRPYLEKNDKDQRGLEKIIVERREKLAPEQRCETPGQHQGLRHATTLLQTFSSVARALRSKK